jgi:hypothetical protein
MATMVGTTRSNDLPTVNPLDATPDGYSDGFVARYDALGTPVFVSYLGGSAAEVLQWVAVDAAGSTYVTGYSTSTDYPLVSPLQPQNNGGPDVILTKLDPSDAIAYSTYLGGIGRERAYGVAVDALGFAYLSGETESKNFPTRNPIQAAPAGDIDAFVCKVTPAGDALVYSTFVGGMAYDAPNNIAVAADGTAYTPLITESADFPIQDPVQAIHGGLLDAAVVGIAPDGCSLVLSTYLGGNDDDLGYGVAVDGDGNLYVAGESGGNFPVLPGGFQVTHAGERETFVARIAGIAAAPCRPPDEVATLHMVRQLGGSIAAYWTNVSCATSYTLLFDAGKASPPASVFLTGTDGTVGVSGPAPAGPEIYFRVRAGNACGEGPI